MPTFLEYENSAHDSQPAEGLKIVAGQDTLYFTNQPVPSLLDGVNMHQTGAGIYRRGMRRRGVEKTGGGVEVEFPRSALESYVPGIPPYPFTVEITRYQADQSQLLGRFQVTESRIEGLLLILQCMPKLEMLMARRGPGMVVTPSCPLALYGKWCRVLRSDHTFPVDIVDVDDDDPLKVTISTNSGRPDDYFSGGEMWWQGEVRTITRHVGTIVWIDIPFRIPLVNGEEVIMHPGCDKKGLTCKNKFLNGPNFQGAPYQPAKNVHLVGVNNMNVVVS